MTPRVSAALAALGLASLSGPAFAREMSADRPDKTESPFTVDKGRFQFETDFANLVLNDSSSELLLGYVNAKYGLAPNADLQAIFSPARRTTENGGAAAWGVSDLTLRLKYNLFGNDEGPRSLGVIGYATLPTERRFGGTSAASGRKVTGGFSTPFATEFAGFDVGAMAQFDFGSTNDLSTMVTFGHELWGDLSGYAEFFNTLPSWGTDGWLATADFGLTYGVSPDLQLDANAHFGLTEASDRLQLFSGFTWRL
jgi:hypothetical protein